MPERLPHPCAESCGPLPSSRPPTSTGWRVSSSRFGVAVPSSGYWASDAWAPPAAAPICRNRLRPHFHHCHLETATTNDYKSGNSGATCCAVRHTFTFMMEAAALTAAPKALHHAHRVTVAGCTIEIEVEILSSDVYECSLDLGGRGHKRCLFLRSWLCAASKLPERREREAWWVCTGGMRRLALACTCRDTQVKVPAAAVILLNTCCILN